MGCGGSVLKRENDYVPSVPPCKEQTNAWEKYHTRSVLVLEAREALEGQICKEPGGILKKVRDAKNRVASKISLGLGCVEFDAAAEQEMYGSLHARSDPASLKAKQRIGSWIVCTSPMVEQECLKAREPFELPGSDASQPTLETETDRSSLSSQSGAVSEADSQATTPLNLFVLKQHNSLVNLHNAAADDLYSGGSTMSPGRSSLRSSRKKSSMRHSFAGTAPKVGTTSTAPSSPDSLPSIHMLPVPTVGGPSSPKGSLGIRRNESFCVSKSSRGDSVGTLSAALKKHIHSGSLGQVPLPPPQVLPHAVHT